MFIDDLYSTDFYKPLDIKDRSRFIFGQIFKTPAYYPHENLMIWRPLVDESDPTSTSASKFVARAVGQDAFRRGYPLATPHLESNEEFIVIRAKVRPVVLIRPELPGIDIDNAGYQGKMQRKRCLVAQVFGLFKTETREAKFNPEFVERIRMMEYYHLMFLPEKAGLLEVDSFIRLDELQSVFTPHLQPTGFALGDDIARILRDQIKTFLTGDAENEFVLLRNMLRKE